MKKNLFLVLLFGGLVLVMVAINESTSLRADFSSFLHISPANKTVWMMIGGVLASGTGFIGLSRFSKTF